MPITQERMIRIASGATDLLAQIDQLKEENKKDKVEEIVAEGNAIVSRYGINSPEGKTIRRLITALAWRYNYLVITLDPSQEIRNAVAEEHGYFRRYEKINKNKAQYAKVKRHIDKQKETQGARQSGDSDSQATTRHKSSNMADLPITILNDDTVVYDEGPNRDDDPEYQKFMLEMKAKFWPEAAPSPQPSANPVTQGEAASTTEPPEGGRGRHGVAEPTVPVAERQSQTAASVAASPAPPISSAPAEPLASPAVVARKCADGTVAYLPPDDELNKPPTLGPKLF